VKLAKNDQISRVGDKSENGNKRL